MSVVPAAKPAPTPAEPDEGVVMMGLDSDHLKRLALQGQRGPAAELARRSEAATVTAFLEEFLTSDELERLSGGQFNVLDDAFEAHWAAANRDTVEVKTVAKSNLNEGWKP